ncbi:hypothetical protein ABW20_dc0109708 [Dactylellina cionopaga]|nr:hypothetical protein ABW20_dc0109708 [Dactylellina cionopaga]
MDYSTVASFVTLSGLIALAGALPLSVTTSLEATSSIAAPRAYRTVYADLTGNTNMRTPAGTGNEGPLSHQAISYSEEANVPQLPPAPLGAKFPYTATYTTDSERATGVDSELIEVVYLEAPMPIPTLYADRNGNTNIQTPAGSSGNGLAHQEISQSEGANKPQFPPAPSNVELPYTTTYAGEGERATDDAKIVVYINAQGGN